MNHAFLSDPLLTQSEVCRVLGISKKTLQVWRRNGRLQFTRLGHRTIRIRKSEIERLAGESMATVGE